MTEPNEDETEPLFRDSVDGGRVRKTFRISHDIDGILKFDMMLGAGRDAVGLSHFLCREDVVDLSKALSVWLESSASVMVGDDEPEFSTPNHDVSGLRLPGDEPEPTCGICSNPHSQCTCLEMGYR